MNKNKITRKTKRIPPVYILAPAVVLGVILLYLLVFRGRPGFARLRGDRDFNVIIITVDTLRADRIGTYGFRRVQTPNMDMFASRGVKFEQCFSQTPLTLPSHTTIMTGTLPIYHGVRDNGGFFVPSKVETMAEVFKEKGYTTAAFVAAYVLDSRWGLNQGFDYYFDRFDFSRFERISLGEVQRPANEVLDEAIPWLDKNKNKKFFAWIHLYDPHTPYEPPPPYKTMYPLNPYLGEIAFTDSQLGRLWKYLEENKLVDNLFLIFASDHGESLGEHQETTHGFFVYQEAIHVPLIFITPFAKFQGISASSVVSLEDIMPTVCEMMDFPAPSKVQGQSLVPIFFNPKKQSGRYAYAETFYPRFHYGCSELVSIHDRRYKLILAPTPELYDLEKDPDEKKNLVYVEKRTFNKLKGDAEALMLRAGREAFVQDPSNIDGETREKLAALGYIGAFADSAALKGKTLPSPKDMILFFNELGLAREMNLQGHTAEAMLKAQKIIAEAPQIAGAYSLMGDIYLKEGKFQEANAAFSKALELAPDDMQTIFNIVTLFIKMRQPEEAERFVLEYIRQRSAKAQLYFVLGDIKTFQEKTDEAMAYYNKCLELNPDFARAHLALVSIYLQRDDIFQAEKHTQAVVAFDPDLTNVNFYRGSILEKRGMLPEAIEAYLLELRNTPKHVRSIYNLCRVYGITGQRDEETKWLKRLIEIQPNFPLGYLNLARNYLQRGDNLVEAASLAKKALGFRLDEAQVSIVNSLLADIYEKLGDKALAEEYRRNVKKKAPMPQFRRGPRPK